MPHLRSPSRSGKRPLRGKSTSGRCRFQRKSSFASSTTGSRQCRRRPLCRVTHWPPIWMNPPSELRHAIAPVEQSPRIEGLEDNWYQMIKSQVSGQPLLIPDALPVIRLMAIILLRILDMGPLFTRVMAQVSVLLQLRGFLLTLEETGIVSVYSTPIENSAT